MKKLLTLFLFILFVSVTAFSQPGELRWAFGFGGESPDFGEGITSDEQGNMYITGFFRGPMEILGITVETESERNAMYLAKVSPAMELLWIVTAEADGTTGASGFKPAYHNGYVYLLGDFRGEATFFSADLSETPMSSETRANFIARYTANGILEWVTRVESSHSSGIITMGSANNLVVDDEGAVYYTTQFRTDINIGGTLIEPGTGGTNFYAILIKLDALGAYQWHWNTTHVGDDRGQALSITPEGNILSAIRYSSAITIGETTTENEGGGLALIEMTPGGEVVTDYQILTDSDHSLGLLVFDMEFDHENNLYMGGSFRTPVSFPDATVIEPLSTTRNAAFVARLDDAMNVVWTQVFGVEDTNEYLRQIAINSEGQLIAAGDFSGVVELGNDVVLSSNEGSQDGFIAAFDLDGTPVWAESFGGTNREDVWGMALSPIDNIYVIGRFMGDFEANDFTQPSMGSFDVAVLRYGSPDSDATLASIHIDDEPLDDFSPGIRTYYVPVSPGVSEVPEVTAVAASGLATLDIEQATDLDGTEEERTAVITVTAEDPEVTAVYRVVFFPPGMAPEYEYNWALAVSGENANFGEGITVDDEGNAYITGFFRGPVDLMGTSIEPESDRNNMLLAKVSPGRELLWYVTAEADGSTGASGFAPAYRNGYVYLLGDFRGDAVFFSADLSETTLSSETRANFIAKYNAGNGLLEWIRPISSSHAGGLVTTGSANSLVVDEQGAVYYTTQFRLDVNIAGTHVEPLTGGTNFYALLVKLDALGAYQWHWNSTLPGDDRGEAITLTPDGNILFSVRYNEALAVDDATTESEGGGIALIELTPGGDYVGHRHILTETTNRAFVFGLAYCQNGQLYVGGHARTTMDWGDGVVFEPVNPVRTMAYIIRLDTDMSVVWGRFFGNPDQNDNLRGLQISSEGTIYAAGDFRERIDFTADLFIESYDDNQDGYLVVYSPFGEPLWAESIGGSNREDVGGLAMSAQDDIYVIGRFMDTFVAHDDEFESAGSFDIFVVKYGIFEELFEVTFEVELDPAIEFLLLEGFDPETHHIYITGSLVGWAEPGDDPENQLMEKTSDEPLVYSKTFHLPAGEYAYKYFSDLIGSGWNGGEWPGGDDRFVTVIADTIVEDIFGYRDDEVTVPEREAAGFRLYPNPASSHLNIESSAGIYEVRLINMLGQVVYTSREDSDRHQINVSGFLNGTYFVQLLTSEGIRTQRIHIAR